MPDKQVPVFLNAIGATMYGLVRSLLAPANPIEQSLEDIVAVLTAHFEPKPLIVVERYYFHKREQASGESVADYVAELRRLASKCKFENVLEDALRDRFVVGLRREYTEATPRRSSPDSPSRCRTGTEHGGGTHECPSVEVSLGLANSRTSRTIVSRS